jgi:beta-glucosidase
MQFKSIAVAFALTLSGCVSPNGIAKPVVSVAPDAKAHSANWPSAASPKTLSSTATEDAITTTLKEMSLEQKVGQLVQADISAITPADLARYPLGSILAGGNSGPYGDERASAAKWAQLVREYQEASRKSGAGIPVIFGVDAVHGHSNLPGATIFPHNIGLGAARAPELIGRIGVATAAEIAGSGIEWTFAPTLAVPQDTRWGRTYEGYADDPQLVAAYAKAMTLGLQGPLVAGKPIAKDRVAATAKHFLADGGTQDGRDQGDARISEAELIAKHAQGYPAAIDAGALTVMVSFSSWNGVKNHGNPSLLTDILKKRMGFDGLVVGDWNGHGQIPGCSATDCPAAINAGLDLFMAPDSWKGVFESTLAAAKDGRISAARLDDAVRRILRVKYKLGLMGDALTDRGDTAAVGAPAHLELAREAVAKSLVLLKNNDSVLPIRKGQNVLIAGPGADNMAMQAGGWTITWQGTDTRAGDFPNGQTVGRAIADAVAAKGGNAAISSDGDYTERPDVAVVVLGEKPYAEFEGDVPNLAFQTKSDEDALIARLKAEGIKVVVVFLSGRPMFAGKLINQSDAFVAAWLPGTQGRGVADVLVASADGKPQRDFTGRLPFAWPANAISPIKNPLFDTGYGLSYAKPGTLAVVNEDAGVDLSSLAQNTNFVVRGKIPAPWHLGIDGAISTRSVDLSAQEDARQFSWNTDGMFAINGPVVDLLTQLDAGASLSIEWRVDQLGNGPVWLSFGEATLDVTPVITSQVIGAVSQSVIPLRCFSNAGAKLDAVGSPLRIAAPKGFIATIRNVRIENVGLDAPCPTKSG